MKARVVWLVMAGLLLPVAASAQLNEFTRTDTISSSGDSITVYSNLPGNANSMGGPWSTVKIQTLDSYSGTWEVQCSVDGTNFDTSAELKISAADGATAVTSVTDEVGIWDVQNATACRALRVISTAGFAASDTVVAVTASQAGGGGGGGGSGSSVTIAQGGNEAVVNMGGELTVSCADCSGTGVGAVDDAAFTQAVDDVVPIAGVADNASVDSVNEDDTGAIRMSANRVLYVGVRDAAGNERGLNVDANGALAAVVSATNLDIQSGGADLATTTQAGAIQTAVQLIDDAIFADNEAFSLGSSKVMVGGGVYQATPATLADGDAGAMLLDENGRVQVGGTVTVDNSSLDVNVLTAIGAGTTAAAVPSGALYGGVNVGGNLVGITGTTEGSITGPYVFLGNPVTNGAVVYNTDPCQTGTKIYLPFQGTADAELITGTASNRTYICHVHLTVAGDVDAALISGTGSVCATSTGALFGGTTAATGWQFVDSRGIAIGDGGSAVGKTDTDADNVCIDVSGAVQFSGVIVYVVAAS